MALTGSDKALRELFEEVWQEADRQAAQALRWTGWQTAEGFRRPVEKRFRQRVEKANQRYDLGNASDRRLLASLFLQDARERAKEAVRVVQAGLRGMPPSVLQRLARRLRVQGAPPAPAPRAARFRRADARNLELVAFVVERIIPFGQLLRPCHPGRGPEGRLLPGHRGPRVALPRGELAQEWNRLHPEWPMSSGETLMAQYYAAVARKHLVAAYLRGLREQVNAAWEALAQAAREWEQRQGAPRRLPARVRRALAFAPPGAPWAQEPFLGQWWTREMKEQEESLSSAELVQAPVADLAARQRLRDPIEDLLAQPLRRWWRAVGR